MRICLAEAADQFERPVRERDLFSQRQDYTWVHAPGQPPFCKGVPPGEAFTKAKKDSMLIDVVESVADVALAAVIRFFKHNDTVASFRRYYPLMPIPAVADRWMQDEEFARQRLDGINPFLIRLATEIPENFPVTDETLRGLIPSGSSLTQLLAEHRLFLVDYEILHGLPPMLGCFVVAPIALFWKDGLGRLMPLAIQLGQTPGEAGNVIFTPRDHHWTWLMARTFLQSADGTYHEVVAHLTRTHLVMETFWVAACRTLPPQHPLHVLLKPHFTGTVDINYEARNTLIAPGGPIDKSIGIGAEGSLTLVGLAYDRWTFDAADPIADLEQRGILSDDVLPHFHYRDDALALFKAIRRYVHDLLRVYYTSDQLIVQDAELQAWAQELVDEEGGRIRGLPGVGAIENFDQLHGIVSQIIYSCSVEHAAVNNGQYAQFGWIPNTPGAMYLEPPKDHSPRSETNFVYALPSASGVGAQLEFVHLLSDRTQTPLGSYPEDFFTGVMPARAAIDRFRGDLDDIGRHIIERNKSLDVPYLYLRPWIIGRSIAI